MSISDFTVILVAAALFVGGSIVLGFGAWAWSRAISAAHQARSHGISVNAQEEINQQAQSAVDEARAVVAQQRPATDDELHAVILAERAAQREMQQRVYNTMDTNEELEETALIPRDSMYVPEDEDRFAST